MCNLFHHANCWAVKLLSWTSNVTDSFLYSLQDQFASVRLHWKEEHQQVCLANSSALIWQQVIKNHFQFSFKDTWLLQQFITTSGVQEINPHCQKTTATLRNYLMMPARFKHYWLTEPWKVFVLVEFLAFSNHKLLSYLLGFYVIGQHRVDMTVWQWSFDMFAHSSLQNRFGPVHMETFLWVHKTVFIVQTLHQHRNNILGTPKEYLLILHSRAWKPDNGTFLVLCIQSKHNFMKTHW